MKKNNLIPTIYNMVMVVAFLAMLLKLYPRILGLMVLVLFVFYLYKVWASR